MVLCPYLTIGLPFSEAIAFIIGNFSPKGVAGILGLEPKMPQSKCGVLPLHHIPVFFMMIILYHTLRVLSSTF